MFVSRFYVAPILASLFSITVVPVFGQGFDNFNPGMDPGNLALIVRQTEDGHQQVEDLLNSLRSLQGTQVIMSTPFQTLNDNYFERIGVDFGFSINDNTRFNENNPPPEDFAPSTIIGQIGNGVLAANGDIDFRQGSFGASVPPFGGFDAGAQTTVGLARLGKNANFFLTLGLSQGNSRTNVTQTPMVLIQDGQTGIVSDTTQRPFVTSVVPVVGGFRPPVPMMPTRPAVSPLRQAIAQYKKQQAKSKGKPAAEEAELRPVPIASLPQEAKIAWKLAASANSSAGRGDESVRAIRQRNKQLSNAKSAIEERELLSYIETARGNEEAGKFRAARINYEMAERRATGALKQQLREKIEQLKKM